MAPPTKLGFMDLPLETQKEIFTFVRKKDLLVAQLASRSLHALASARLYRDLKFTFIFPAEGYPAPVNHNKPEFRLPEALHTFLTSEHDYAQYIRLFALLLPQQQSEENARKAVSRYHVEEEANKLLNTTLLVMLRKAKKLESFLWDPSIELSGQVYQALSRLPSLQNLYIRLDNKAVQRISSVSLHPSPVPTNSAPLFGNPSNTVSTTASSMQTVVIKNSSQSQTQAINSRRFSDFKNLRHLEILGMDDLGSNVEQMATCLTTCSGTLKSITLSLSQDLARRARKTVAKPAPQNPELGETTADDDDATVSDVPPPPAPTTSTNDAEARKEKAIQDSVLAVLFGLEKRKKTAKKIDKALEAAAARMLSIEDTQHLFLEAITNLKKGLIEKPPNPLGKEASQDLHEILDSVSTGFLGTNKKPLAEKAKTPKASKFPNWGKSKKPTTVHQFPLSVPAQLQNLSNEDFALWAHQHAHLLNDEYGEFSVNGPLPGLPVHSSSSNYPPSTSNPFTTSFGASSHTLPHHHSTSNKPVSMTSSAYPYGPFGSSAVGPSNASSYLSDYQMQMLLLEQQQKKQKLLVNKQKKYAEMQKMNAQLEEEIAGLNKNAVTSSESEESDTQSDTDEEMPLPEESAFFPAAESSAKDKDDGMDIDMEHPDVFPSVEKDSDPDQEMMNGADYDSADLSDPWTETISKSKGKGKEVVLNESVSPKTKPKGKSPANGHLVSSKLPAKSKGKKTLKSQAEKSKADEEDMQEYLRTTHGFHIEDFCLYLVPIKASVMAKALDLTFLRRLRLLGVGSQAGFWTLMSKIHAEAGTIKLQSIHTDDVSMAFLHAVSTFPPLQSLYLMKRSAKDTDFSPTKNPGSIDDIRIFALRRHLVSLTRLVLNNQDNTSWDLNDAAVRLICSSGYNLIELGVSIHMNEYHTLLQNMPGLSALQSLHVITLRTTDQCHAAARETRKFTLDSLGHCPTVKIKYLVLNSNQVLELHRKGFRRAVARMQAQSGNSGGKPLPEALAITAEPGPPLAEVFDSLKKLMSVERAEWITERIAEIEACPEKGDDGTEDGEVGSRKRFREEVERKSHEVAVAKTVKFWDVDGVEMFGKRVRVGKL